jgi:methanogen homoaconitase small subunit
MKVEGIALCLGDNVDTDVIIAGRYLRTKDKGLWAAKAFEDLDPALAARLTGAFIVAGKNFGCGSSREQAAVALKEAGVSGVCARSFGRIFFRNAINIGLPVVECDHPGCTDGTPVIAELRRGWIEIGGVRVAARPLTGRMSAILEAGGLVEYLNGKALQES